MVANRFSVRKFLLLVGFVAAVTLASCSSGGVETSSGGVAADTTQAPEATSVSPSTAAEAAPETTVSDATVPEVATTVAAAVDPLPEVHPGYADNFGESIAPIFASRCAACHNAGGPGSVHWVLEDVDDIVADASYVSAVVASGVMPPWPASDLSPAFHGDRGLSAEELTAIADWAEAGLPVDVAGDTPIVGESAPGLDAVDATLTAVDPYDGSPALVDDYRCLIYDPGLTEATWVEGFNFIADQTEVVHHVIGYAVPGDQRASADALSADDDGGGWECYGGSGLSADELLIAWAPGQGATVYPENTGLLMQPGDFFVLQLHYHFEIDAPTDNSLLEISYGEGSLDYDEILIAEYLGPTEIPCMVGEVGPLCDRDTAYQAAIAKFGPFGGIADAINGQCGVSPADFADMTDGFASSTCDLPVQQPGEIVSIFGHEHEIGSSFRMTLNPDTPDEKILLDIPKWSFDWQYNYYPIESIVLERTDVIRVECTWDRSLRDPKLEPSYILWANGTNDEMCFSNIITRAG